MSTDFMPEAVSEQYAEQPLAENNGEMTVNEMRVPTRPTDPTGRLHLAAMTDRELLEEVAGNLRMLGDVLSQFNGVKPLDMVKMLMGK